MSAVWGNNIRLSLFGESHGPAIGMVVDGFPPNVAIDLAAVQLDLNRRAPGQDATATKRKEADAVEIVSGLLNGKTTGAPLCGIIRNTNTRSQDYADVQSIARPGHADFTGFVRYAGANDVRGGGHFSGRLTAPLVFAGALARQWLRRCGIEVGAHIAAIESVLDERFDLCDVNQETLIRLQRMKFPVLKADKEPEMRRKVEEAHMREDSVGGLIECAACGVPAGWGSPFFDSVESVLAHLVFSVPATKGIEFGSGFDLAGMRASQANDAMRADEQGRVYTETNYNGGINGGITNGMPIVFRTAIKPTPSIAKEQKSVDYRTKKNETIRIRGRHDPCIVPRAVPVMEACLAIALMECALETGKQEGDTQHA